MAGRRAGGPGARPDRAAHPQCARRRRRSDPTLLLGALPLLVPLLAAGLIVGVAIWPVLLADLFRAAGLDTLAVPINGLDVQLGSEATTPLAVAVVVVIAVVELR